MKFNFLEKQTSRRDMLRGSAMLAGSAFLANFLPTTLLRASAPGYGQQTPSADLLASMRAKFNGAPLKTQRLGEDLTMFSGPGRSVVVLNGPDGKFVVDTFVAPAWPRLREALDGLGKRILALQDGPSILVAHSYGGAVITEAGNDPSVVGMVYIAAHMPDSGEKESDDGKRFPSDLAKSGAIKKTPDGFTYIDPAQFHELFAADVPGDKAAFMARSQVLNFADNFLRDDHHGCLENQTELDAGGGRRSNHQPGLGTLVRQAGQQP